MAKFSLPGHGKTYPFCKTTRIRSIRNSVNQVSTLNIYNYITYKREHFTVSIVVSTLIGLNLIAFLRSHKTIADFYIL